MTHKILKDENKIKIQGIKKKFRVLGIRQIPEKAELANAFLIKKPSGFYIHIVCYLSKENVLKEIKEKRINQSIGVDLGIKHQLTLSTGEKLNWFIPETKRLKFLQKALSKKHKGSKNYQKTKELIKKEWEYIYNKRQDTLNKAVSHLKKFSLVAVQNDSIKGWHKGWFGKQVQDTGIGGITARLKSLATLIPVFFVDRYEPTTQTCFVCGNREQIPLSQRVFRCSKCGAEIDRDVNSARNILKLALEKLTGEGQPTQTLPTDCGEVKPVEMETTARILGSNSYIRVSYTSLKQEAR